MQKGIIIFRAIIVYVLNLSTHLCYEIVMKHAGATPMRVSKGPNRQSTRRGQTLVEYALILAVISIVAIGVLINMGQQVKGVYSTIDTAVEMAHNSH